MNRAQRRKFNKQHRTNYSASDFKAIELYALFKEGRITKEELLDNPDIFSVEVDPEVAVPDGTLVKINYQAYLSRPQKDYTEQFKDWLKVNKDKTFKVYRTENPKSSLVSLRQVEAEENTNELDSIWLFDIYTDLLYRENENEWLPWDNKKFLEKMQ